MACCICLANEGPPLLIPCGCGCREAAGCVHVASAGYHAGWHACPTCKQGYTGAMELGPAEALWVRLQVRVWVSRSGGMRARGISRLPRGLACVPDLQAGLHGRDGAWPGGSPVGAAASPASRGRTPPVCAEHSSCRMQSGGPLRRGGSSRPGDRTSLQRCGVCMAPTT